MDKGRSRNKAMIAAMLCLFALLLLVVKVEVPGAYADALTEHSGLPVEKWVGKYCFTVRNTVQNPQRGTFCVFTRTKSTSYAVPANTFKMRPRAANAKHKLVQTGSWKWRTKKLPLFEECWVHMVLKDNIKICSYGQMQPKNGTALTGVITPPASPAYG